MSPEMRFLKLVTDCVIYSYAGWHFGIFIRTLL